MSSHLQRYDNFLTFASKMHSFANYLMFFCQNDRYKLHAIACFGVKRNISDRFPAYCLHMSIIFCNFVVVVIDFNLNFHT